MSDLRLPPTRHTREAWRLAAAIVLTFVFDAAFLPFPVAAATSISTEQWKNTSGAWGGTLNGTNSAYAEGLTIPSRVVIIGETGAHALEIVYDFQDSSSTRHFVDFVESFDRTVPRSTADPCAGVTGRSGSPTTVGIPADSTIANQRAGVMSIWNASGLSLSGYSTTTSGHQAPHPQLHSLRGNERCGRVWRTYRFRDGLGHRQRRLVVAGRLGKAGGRA